MTIGYDAKRLFHNKTGLGVYSRQLLTGLVKFYPNHKYVLFSKAPNKSPYYKDFMSYPIVQSRAPLWRSWGVNKSIKNHHCQIYHGLSHELPIGIKGTGVATIVTMHDVIFKVDPGLYPAVDRWTYDKKWNHACRVADRIIAISEQTKRDLCHYYQVDPSKIHVIHPPFGAAHKEVDHQKIKKKYRLPDQFFLYVGALTKRKNVIVILRAMALQKPTHRMPLVIVGAGREKSALLRYASTKNLDNLLIFLGHLDRRELAGLYQLSIALIYPSLYEGFGLPIVEAIQNKTGVITSNISSMPEALGPGGLTADPTDERDILAKMEKMAGDSDLRADLIHAGTSHIKSFSIENIARKHIELYQSLL